MTTYTILVLKILVLVLVLVLVLFMSIDSTNLFFQIKTGDGGCGNVSVVTVVLVLSSVRHLFIPPPLPW